MITRGIKGARRKILSPLHPNTNIHAIPDPDPDTNSCPPTPPLVMMGRDRRGSGKLDHFPPL